MAHIPTTESDDQKVFWIARVLDISLEDAALTCAGFELAFGDDRMRRAIFEIIDQLDESAAKKGEPLGLIINYTVELGNDGIRVGRYADEIPAGGIVELVPPHSAAIHLRIVDNFPTQEFLGPLIVNRPGWHFDTFDLNAEVSEDLSHFESAKQPICLGPIRLKFNERFPCVSATRLSSQRAVLPAVNLAFHSAGMPAFQSSGLSPPHPSENLGHSGRKMFLRPLGKKHVETHVSHLDL